MEDVPTEETNSKEQITAIVTTEILMIVSYTKDGSLKARSHKFKGGIRLKPLQEIHDKEKIQTPM